MPIPKERVDPYIARHCAKLAAESYQTTPEYYDYHMVESVSYGTDDATLFWRPGRFVIAFRGTDTASEWLWNVMVVPERWRLFDVEVHGGFFAHFIGLWDKLTATATYKRHRDQSDDQVIYTGHSRGGAIAQLAGLYTKPDLVCTFGSPRVGGRSFRAVCERSGIRHWRIVNTLDVITRLPLPIWYRHYGLKYRASWTGTHTINDYIGALS